MDGLRKVRILPAGRLERAVPAMGNKGRVQIGADADITVFDPDTIKERAIVSEPYHYSHGIHHVLVNGVVVLRDGSLIDDVSPGRWLRH